MNIAVIGCGYWGKNHVRVLDELGHLRGICDSKMKVGNSLIKQYCHLPPGASWSSLYTNYLEAADVDAVVIATPTDTHYRIVMDALKAGKHVLVEKPMATDTKEAEEMIEEATKQGKILMVGHILEHHPAIIQLKEYIKHGHLGEIQYIYSNRLNIGRIRKSEDVLSSFAPHDIALILGIVGQTPNNVYVEESEYMTKGVSDITMMHLEFPGGVKGHIFVSWLHPVKEQKLVVIGDRGMAVFDDSTEEKVRIYDHKIEWVGSDDVASIRKAEYKRLPGASVSEEPLKAELESFIKCCESGGKIYPRVSGIHGWQVLKVMEMARRKDPIQYELKKMTMKIDREMSDFEGGEVFSMTSPLLDLEEEAPRNTLWYLAGIFVHESCYIDEDVDIGEGTKVWHFSHIQKGAKIGENCTIGQNVNIGPGVVIGNNVKIQNNVSVYEGVTIEDNVFLGPSCVFTNVRKPRDFGRGRKAFSKTLVERGAVIGANATIVCGVTIERYAFVAAGSVVTKDVPSYNLVMGNPADIKD